MDTREDNVKKIVAVVLVIVVIIAILIGVRSCGKKDEKIEPTPTPTATVTPEPTSTPDDEENDTNSNHNYDTGYNRPDTDVTVPVNNEPEVTPTPTPEVIDLEGLKNAVKEASTVIDNLVFEEGSSDSTLIDLLAELSTVEEEGAMLLQEADLTQAKVDAKQAEIEVLIDEITERIAWLTEDATNAVSLAEEKITSENYEMAVIAVGKLPISEVKEELQNRLQAIESLVGTIAYITNEDELMEALANEDITTIELENDLEDISGFVIDRPMNFEGNEYQMTFKEFELKGITIISDDVVLNNVSVALTDEIGWQGSYGVHVYNSKNVVLNNYTGMNADAALLVNASEVELTGITNVSNNEFGGIEVSKGIGEDLENSVLTISGTIVNETEAYALPTVWVIKGEGTVNGTFAATNEEIKEDQIQYYLVEENATDSEVVVDDDEKEEETIEEQPAVEEEQEEMVIEEIVGSAAEVESEQESE